MAGMKRFVTYIYSYEEGKKGSNIGFAKIEIRGEDCRIEVHLRGVYAAQPGCRVCLFRIRDTRIEGIPIGEMRLVGGRGDFGAVVKAGRIMDTPLGINDMEGIVLLGGEELIFLSRWREGTPFTVRQDNFVEWQPDIQEESVPVTESETAIQQDAPEAGQDAEIEQVVGAGQIAEEEQGVKEAAEPEPERESQNEPENVQATELPVRNVFPAYDWREVWEKLQKNHPIFTPFEDHEAVCIQIELKDIRELPRRYWYLGNNSFLLHGFFNYQYLVIGKTGEARWFLGVPGIYQRQERVMAAVFGFPEFLPAAVRGEGSADGEPINRFGCWYRYIEE